MATELDSIVEAFEQARAAGQAVEMRRFLPPPDDNAYREIALELMRVDMEYRWRAGMPIGLEYYLAEHADVLQDSAAREALAFEEYRQRLAAGQPVTREGFANQYEIDTRNWPGTDGTEKQATATGPSPFPAVGDSLHGFQLVRELGRGAVGRVFLAQQHDLAHRHVVLKLTKDVTSEPQRLAQLQHANIVPIYSLYRHGGLQVICMPYFGDRTLSDCLAERRTRSNARAELALNNTAAGQRDDTMPALNADPLVDSDSTLAADHVSVDSADLGCARSGYDTDAALKLMQGIAAGLTHAHRRGIVHRDLKPANVLIREDEEPLLLDFNLAADLRGGDARSEEIGGTLPYMAPEQLASLETGERTDARADVYACGVLWFEMLCGTRPFSDVGGSGHRQWRAMRAQRQQGVPSLRLLRRHTSPDVVSMVAKCLAPRPENRYPSGADLLEDITRHLECRPLRHAPNRSWRERGRKWVKRHPRLGSGINVAVIAAVLILVASVGLLIRGRQVERLRAQSQRHEFLESLPEIRAALTTPDLEPSLLRETVVQGELLLQPYLADSTGDWRQQSSIAFLEPTANAELTTTIENLMLEFAVATDRLAVLSADEDRGAKTAAAARWRRLAGRAAGASSPPDWNDPSSAADDDLELLRRRVRGTVAVGEYAAAVPLAQIWRRRAPQDYEGWFLSGNALSGAGRTAEAEACFTSCIVLSPTSHWAFFQRGLCRLESRLWHGAREDFSRVLELRPELTGALINRALAWRELERPDEAIKDLDQALRDGRAPTRCFFLRAQIHDSQGRSQAAVEDRQIGLSREPHDPLSWVARGVARLPDDPHGALADFDAALEMDPGCVQALQNSASVLSERLGQSDAALERLTRLLQQTPNDLDATAGRCVLLARQGRYDDALGGVPALVSSPLEALYVYQAACVHALAAGDDPAHESQSLRWLARAVHLDPTFADIAPRDPDMANVSKHAEFQRIVAAAAVLRHAAQTPAERAETP